MLAKGYKKMDVWDVLLKLWCTGYIKFKNKMKTVSWMKQASSSFY